MHLAMVSWTQEQQRLSEAVVWPVEEILAFAQVVALVVASCISLLELVRVSAVDPLSWSVAVVMVHLRVDL